MIYQQLVCIAILGSLDFVHVQGSECRRLHTNGYVSDSVCIENIALKQATYQIGTKPDGFSSRAVDGNRDPVYDHDSCTHTTNAKHPWWAVDLQWSRQIATVKITNRQAVPGRLQNMTIGTTDVRPDETAPTPDNINVCHFQEAHIPAGQTETYPCDVTGRYLVVVLKLDKQILTLCEVEVYEVQSGVTVEPPTVSPPEVLPYNYRPSVEYHVTLCYLKSLTPEEQQTARNCFRECFLHPCCKAVNITSCEQSYVKSESFHYVKEGLTTEPTESCSCAVEFGGTAGTPFSLFNTFEATESSIRNISVFYEPNEGIKGIFVEYEGKYVAGVAGEGFRSRDQNDCILHPYERITEVVVYQDITYNVDVLYGLKFITTRQTCGTFGLETANVFHASGHQLLFLSGRVMDQITSLTLHFDYNCTTL